MKQHPLAKLFQPESVAVIGASTEPGTVGQDIAKNLLDGRYGGRVFLVNPKTDRLLGVPCYPDIAAIGTVPDLAIIVVPAAIVPTVLRTAGKIGTPAAVIISAGFGETDEHGKQLEQEITEIAEEYGIDLLGPNCLGFLDPSTGLNASFAPRLPKRGSVAFFSQSGALMTSTLDIVRDTVGFSKVISTGNKAVIDEHDLIMYLRNDSETDVISFYTEGIKDAGALIALGRDIATSHHPKPLIALKSGRSESGQKASSSHTGALAGSDASYEALFRQARIVRADSMRSFLDVIAVFAENPLPDGNRIAIITNAGGPGVLATDAAEAAGLSLPELSPDSLDRFIGMFPKAASINNPIDILGDARSDRYRLAIDTAADDPNVDALLVILTPQSMTEAETSARAIVDARKTYGKPIITVLSGGKDLDPARAVLRQENASVFTYPEAGAAALGLLARSAHWRESTDSNRTEFPERDRDSVRDIFRRVRESGRTQLYEYEVYDVLRAYDFPTLRYHVVRNAEEAEEAAKDIDGPVAMKIVSPDIIHKTDAGGVMIGIEPEEADDAFLALYSRVREKRPKATLEGAIVMEMAKPDGKELIIGAKYEEGLGTVLVLGMGGIYTESIRDATFRFAPLTRGDAEEMFSELRSARLLSGVRGEPGIDRDTLFTTLERLSRLVEDFPEIEELDINPFFASSCASASVIADARITLGNGSRD